MLSLQDRAIVKSTVPLLESGGEALMTHFYRTLLEENPSVRPLFNQAHQASGDQPRALANGVLMYARHIDQLDALDGLLARIINKHVALQILPEQYPVVGGCLLRAIETVLGSAIATPEVLAAWGNAYQQLADILIAAESQVYQQKADAPGGWRGARDFKLTARIQESEAIVSFYFTPMDGLPILEFRAGQYLGIKLLIDGQEHRRNYSLSALGNGREYRISVKREAAGAVSTFLHEHLQLGDQVQLFAPSGECVLQDSGKPLVLISAGVGITPTLAMLEAALPSGRPITFIHCARSAAVHGFRAWVDNLAARHPQLVRFYCYGQDDGSGAADAVGRLGRAHLADWLPANRDLDAYFLGPKGFMKAVKGHLEALGVPALQLHYECFGPASLL